MKKVWALPVSLATTPRIVIYFLFLALLRCFSSGGSLSTILCIQIEMHATLLAAGFPIRKSPDHSLLTATRSLSQSSTSFIGDIRLGIHCSALEYLFMHWFWLVVGLHQLLLPSIPLSYHQKFEQIVKLQCSHLETTRVHPLSGTVPRSLES